MISIQVSEQNAADVHGLLERMQGALHDEELIVPIRSLKLALAGGLRAHGWTPAPGGWAKRAAGRRR